MCNQFVRANLPGQGWTTQVLLAEPVPLTHGKSAPAILAASHRDWKSLRSIGHSGCCVEHYVWDRAGISALERLTRQWHLAQDMTLLPPDVPEEIARLTEFVCVTPCALHDAQNAFRWGLYEQCNDSALQRDVYIAIESLRNSSDLISRHISEWIASRLSLVPRRGEAWVDRQRQLWHALDVDLETVDMMAADLQLCWGGGRLCVMEGTGENMGVVACAGTCLMSAWKFVNWA